MKYALVLKKQPYLTLYLLQSKIKNTINTINYKLTLR